MPNQFKPLPPVAEMEPHIRAYWKMRLSDQEILHRLTTEHMDLTKYGMKIRSFRKMRHALGLRGTRQQKHTLATIREPMIRLRNIFPNMGARDMGSELFLRYDLKVSRNLVVKYFNVYEPELVRQRKKKRLRRRRFWSAGVNDIIAVDQHDKWKRFGLALHVGVDPFCGILHWMKIWWTNSNPKLIASYYLNVVELNGSMCMVTQSDPGSENYGLANAQTTLRHLHDPRLRGTIQHRWYRQKQNVMPEIQWSNMRARFTPGFESILDIGVDDNMYDMTKPLDVLVFRWIFIPWLQSELDAYCQRINFSKKRSDKNKVLPHGVPADIYKSPHVYGCHDFKINVNPEHLAFVRQKFAPPDDPVFQLVPPAFAQLATTLFGGMGSPMVDETTCWPIYWELLSRFEHFDAATQYMDRWAVEIKRMDMTPEEILIEGRDLDGGIEIHDENGNYYMGGVNNGRGYNPDDEDLDKMFDMEEFHNGDDTFMVDFFSDEEVDAINASREEEW